MNKQLTDIFEVDSVPKTLVLCILTIGSYFIYKLYCFSNQINRHTEFKISKIFITTTIVLFAFSSGSLIYGLVNYPDLAILKSSIGIHAISSVFHVTYMQHKINQSFVKIAA